MIVFIDETNCNLFLLRSRGHSRKGTRCSVIAPTSKGKNIQYPNAAIQRDALAVTGKIIVPNLRVILRAVTESLYNVVVVCNKAPVHAAPEPLFEEEEFASASLLRASLYGAPINPIAECWSATKATMKLNVAARMTALLNSTLSNIYLYTKMFERYLFLSLFCCHQRPTGAENLAVSGIAKVWFLIS